VPHLPDNQPDLVAPVEAQGSSDNQVTRSKDVIWASVSGVRAHRGAPKPWASLGGWLGQLPGWLSMLQLEGSPVDAQGQEASVPSGALIGLEQLELRLPGADVLAGTHLTPMDDISRVVGDEEAGSIGYEMVHNIFCDRKMILADQD